VSWNDAQTFLKRISAILGKKYRLPTESEWEYTARGASNAIWPFGDTDADLPQHAWLSLNSARKTHAVGGKKPNAYGVYDLLGNVWEWTEDVWHESYDEAPNDGSAWVIGGDSTRRSVRGGSWNFGVKGQRPANRYWGGVTARDYDLGFRVARDADEP
jgi:formylglycine-generating enzyme required for sulfatase activity